MHSFAYCIVIGHISLLNIL